MTTSSNEGLEADWKILQTDLNKFESKHKEYVKKLEEVESMKKNYSDQFSKFKKKLEQLNQDINKKTRKSADPNLDVIKSQVDENLNYMRQIADTFPQQNGLYLKVILGNICVSILNKDEKWRYKEEYENFKFNITCITLIFSFLLVFIQSYRVLDAIFNFLLVWYYCTLTIRESILVVNGSCIKGWWQTHHFITTVCTAILLIWPDSQTYQVFRQQFIWFSFYISFVQLLQYYYQKGSLYRLRALGEKQDMDTTVEGFQSWMTRGLSFLLPFLFFGYFWELYNAYVLFYISQEDFCHEWQVPILSAIFFILFAGNFYTTYMVIRKKFKSKINTNINRLRYKYYDWKKLKSPGEKEEKPQRDSMKHSIESTGSTTDTSTSSIGDKND